MSDEENKVNLEEKLNQMEKKLAEATAPKKEEPSVEDIANKITAIQEEKTRKESQSRMVKQLADKELQEALPNVIGDNESVAAFMDRLKSGEVSESEFKTVVNAAKFASKNKVVESNRPVAQSTPAEDTVDKESALRAVLEMGTAFDSDPLYYTSHKEHRERVKEYNKLYKASGIGDLGKKK